MKNKLDVLSDLTGASKSTVSKAIRHCFGVDRESRELILRKAKEMGVESDHLCDYYCIFPDRPSGFWNGIVSRIHDACPQFRGKFNVYPPDSAFVLGDYLDEAKKLGAQMIVTCVRPNERQYELLCQAAREIPMIFLFERVDIVNTFCVYSDARADGAAICGKTDPGNDKRVLIIRDGSVLSEERIEGFTGGLCAGVTYIDVTGDASASELARVMSASALCPDVIYNSVGSVRETALAAVKLGLRGKCTVAGHGYGDAPFVRGDVSGLEFVELCPDAERVCRLTAEAVREYVKIGRFPDNKHTVIPSVW